MKNSISVISAIGAACALVLSSAATAQGSYTNLGRGSAVGVSDDGSVVVGNGFTGAFRWTAMGGQALLAGAASTPRAAGIAGDGSVIIGDLQPEEAAIWTAIGGWVGLGAIPYTTGCAPVVSSAFDISTDGSVVVGLGWSGCLGLPFLWSQATGMVEFSVLGPGSARANCVSGDGLVVAGWDEALDGQRRAAVWYQDARGEVLLLPQTMENPNGAGEVWDCNSDGSVMVGWGVDTRGRYAFRWTAAGGVLDLGLGRAMGTNEDGSIIVGQNGDLLSIPEAGFVWTAEDGVMGFEQFVANQGIAIPPGPPVTAASRITPDGKFIVGTRGDFRSSNDEGFLVELPAGLKYGLNAAPANLLDLAGSGSSSLGGTFVATTSNLTQPFAVTILSARSAKIPFLGGMFLVDLAGPVLTVPSVAPATAATFNIPIPNRLALVGASLYLQSLAPEPGTPADLAFSNGLELTIRS